MLFGDRVIGVLTLDKHEPDFYTEDLGELASAFATQAATAIENARLLETERAAREQAETLRAAAQSLGSALRRREVFDLILSELRKVVPYDSCSVQQIEGEEMVIVGGHGFPNLHQVLNSRVRLALSRRPRSRGRRAARAGDHPEGLRALRALQHRHARRRARQGLAGACRCSTRGRLIGMLTLDKLEADFYTDEHSRDGEGVRGLRGDGDREGPLRRGARAAQQEADGDAGEVAFLAT